MLDCERARDLISLYVDGELGSDEKALLEEHLAGCEECAKLLSLYSEVSLLMADDAEPPAELLAGVMNGVREIKAEKKPKKKASVIALRWAAVAASLALVSFVGVKVFGGGIDMSESAVFDAESNGYSSGAAAPKYGFDSEDSLSMDCEPDYANDYGYLEAEDGSAASYADKYMTFSEGAALGSGFEMPDAYADAPLAAGGEAIAEGRGEPDFNRVNEPEPEPKSEDSSEPDYTEDEIVYGSGEWIRIVYEDGAEDEALALVEELDYFSLCEFPEMNAIAVLPEPLDEEAMAELVEQLEANDFIISVEPEPPQF